MYNVFYEFENCLDQIFFYLGYAPSWCITPILTLSYHNSFSFDKIFLTYKFGLKFRGQSDHELIYRILF